ncbi:MAG: hypothetical protein KAW56_02255 [Candidatus Marinimicrobia bacterium]|nr:hypothetical protein [Candidatus Neomarinimicrobiota bacterium]MCK4445884.1 hypothetical protein [Candidatus Neomarinimicrobiota bacterium]
MLRFDLKDSWDSNYIVKEDLDKLLKHLKKGMKVQGRIVDCLGDNRYLLRIRGYNILTYSEQLFQRFDDIQLTVVEVEPHFVLDLLKERHTPSGIVNKEVTKTNILIY